MQYYSKVIVAVVGLLVLLGSQYGLDLESSQQTIADALIGIATAVSVYWVPNKPTTIAQVDAVRAVTNEAAADIRGA